MKRKIQDNFKSYQKIFLLLLILLATLLFGFINGSFNAVEGLFLAEAEPIDNNATLSHHKSAADRRSSGDGKIKKNENDLYGTDSALNSG